MNPHQSPNSLPGHSSSPHPLSSTYIPPTHDPQLPQKLEFSQSHHDYSRALEVVKRLYITLIIIGLVIGGVLSVGVLAAMKHFGLLGVPVPVEKTIR